RAAQYISAVTSPRVLVRKLRAADAVTRDVALYSAAFAFLRLWSIVGRPVIRYPDSASYFYVDFLGHAAGGRSPTVPLLYTALWSDRARVAAQVIVGIACWSTLAFAVAKSLRHPYVARAGALLVLLLGATIQVTEWDQIILSESLSISLTALLL